MVLKVFERLLHNMLQKLKGEVEVGGFSLKSNECVLLDEVSLIRFFISASTRWVNFCSAKEIRS